MKCPFCGAAELIRDTRDVSHTYKGEITIVPDLTGDFCPACCEVVLDKESGGRYSEWIGAHRRQVDAAYVEPAYITKVREKLALSQQEATEIFGGGVDAFFRYERARTRPPLALVQLLKLLDRHPELLDEVRGA